MFDDLDACTNSLCGCSYFQRSNIDPSICSNCKHNDEMHRKAVHLINIQNTTLFGEPARTILKELDIEAPHAKSVDIKGSFDSWRNSYSLTRRKDNTFSCCISLPEGRHEFKFILDGINWSCSNKYPTLRDSQGNENNYVDVVFD
ncbi:hypothetical protein P9112_013084 [Eukaryota sp. TZLM1-RC]